MKFNFKRKIKNSDVQEITKNNPWQKFDDAILRLQYKCANWLERKTANFTRLNWMLFLLSFTVLTTSCSLYVLVNSFSSSQLKSITVLPISKPTNAVYLKEKSAERKEIISKTEYEKITSFRKYMDSLGRSPTGKKTYDSIVSDRPGLLDSLTIIENYYFSHLKN